MSAFQAAREWMESMLAAAECRYDRREARAIAERIVEISEQEDFDECRRLDQPTPRIISEPDID